jgi:hypothetical protein
VEISRLQRKEKYLKNAKTTAKWQSSAIILICSFSIFPF